MLKKLMVTLLSVFFIACGVLLIVTMVYFITPSQKAAAGISLPDQIEDSAKVVKENSTESVDEGYDNIYIADVHQSLTLRSQPDSNSAPLIEEGLAPMTKMQVLNFVEGTNFAYVEVINGEFQGNKGYVNTDYITRLGEPTIRVYSD